MVTKQIFIFIFSIFFFTFLVTKRYTLQLYVIHWNPPVKDSQSQVSHGLILIYILHMVAPRQSGANTNATPTLHALTRKGLPLPLAGKLQRKLVTTEIFFFFHWEKPRSKFKVIWAVIRCASPLEIPKQRERERERERDLQKNNNKKKKVRDSLVWDEDETKSRSVLIFWLVIRKGCRD